MLKLIIGLSVFSVCSYSLPSHVNPATPDLRIVGGKDAADHVAPYVVYVQRFYPNSSVGTCAGSLLSNNYVLTAAHCLYGMVGNAVVLGITDLNKISDPTVEIRVNGTWKIHEQYKSLTTVNDIAIIRLPKPVQYNSFIQPVKLPSKSDSGNTYEGQSVTVYGWGLDGTKTLPKKLQTVDLTVTTLKSCKLAYIPYRQPVTENQLCTLGSGKGVCEGDSGGPAMLNGAQVGITSFVAGTCGSTTPAVHVNVARYLDWIQANSDVVIN